MPDGYAHLKATVIVSAVAPAGLWLVGLPLPQVGACALGCLSGVILSPDLDCDSGCISMHVVRRLFGGVVAWLWQIFWLPYSILLPHRSFWSHGPVISTLIRVGYLGLWGLLVVALFHWPLPEWSPLWGWALAGLVTSDLVHTLMDRLF